MFTSRFKYKNTKTSIFDETKYFMKDKRAQLLGLHKLNIPLPQMLFPYFRP